MSGDGATYLVELDLQPERALVHLEETVEAWGGETERQASTATADEAWVLRMGLPVRAGLRHGWVAGLARARPTGDATEVSFQVDRGDYRVDKAAFTVLLLAAAGALVTIVAPMVPRLLPLVPLGIFLAIGAWLFIVARLRNSGPEELFESLELELGRESEHGPDQAAGSDDSGALGAR